MYYNVLKQDKEEEVSDAEEESYFECETNPLDQTPTKEETAMNESWELQQIDSTAAMRAMLIEITDIVCRGIDAYKSLQRLAETAEACCQTEPSWANSLSSDQSDEIENESNNSSGINSSVSCHIT